MPGECQVRSCNCSICRQSGFIHLIVEKDDFVLKRGQEDISDYRFNTGTARHLFCRHCGIKSFYIPRSHPDGYSVNVNCIDLHPDIKLETRAFDGKNWSRNIDELLSDQRPGDQ